MLIDDFGPEIGSLKSPKSVPKKGPKTIPKRSQTLCKKGCMYDPFLALFGPFLGLGPFWSFFGPEPWCKKPRGKLYVLRGARAAAFGQTFLKKYIAGEAPEELPSAKPFWKQRHLGRRVRKVSFGETFLKNDPQGTRAFGPVFFLFLPYR